MDEKEFSVINVIPFIDIMLVLLTIVLTTSTFVVQGALPLRLPSARAGNATGPRGHTIEVGGGRLLLDGQATTVDGLRRQLQPVDRSAPVLIRADRELPLKGFVEVLDCVTCLGFRTVSLQTEATNGRPG